MSSEEDLPTVDIPKIGSVKLVKNPKGLDTVFSSGANNIQGHSQVLYRGCVLPVVVLQQLETIHTTQLHPSDVLICGSMKTGTTWVSEIIYQLLHEDDDPTDSDRPPLVTRVPSFSDVFTGLPIIQRSQPPRLIRSHLHVDVMPPSLHTAKPKIIYTIRNPKDTCVSLFHFYSVVTNHAYKGTFQEFFQEFLDGQVMFGPFCSHLKGFMEHKQQLNILFISYEDLVKDTEQEIRKIATFLDTKPSDKKLETILSTTSFTSMRENKSMNNEQVESYNFTRTRFLRKGMVGDWKAHFSKEQSKLMDNLVEKEIGPLGIRFNYG